MAEETKIDPELAPVRVLADAFRQDAAEDQRLAAAKLLQDKAKEDTKFGNKATETQMVPLIFSVLSRNYEGALDALNGGRIRYSDAIGPNGQVYKQERNSRGTTGNYYDYVSGEKLSPEQLKDVQKNGWLVSKEDMTASQVGTGRGAFEGAASLRKAPYDVVVGAYQNAQKQAIASSGIANQYDELYKIAARSRDDKTKTSWLDTWNKLPANERARLAAAATVQTQSNQGATKETSVSKGASAGNQANLNKTLGAEVGGGVSGKGAVPPGSPNPTGINPSITGGVSGSNAAGTAAQTGVTANTGAGAATSTSSGVNQQAGFRNIVEGIFNQKMNDQQVADFQRFLQLTTTLENIQKERKPENLAPGSEAVGEIDPLLSGMKNTGITAVKGMRNEALLAEWTHFQADKMNSQEGRAPDLSKWSQEFQNTEKYQAINNRFNAMLSEAKGEKPQPKVGEVWVDNKNKLIVYKGDGKWEHK
jgi:hypothetical protein